MKIANEPLVSIIMNCYNSDKFLNQAIESVLNQNYHKWEIIFWDNQSSDKSAEIVNSYSDKRIKYFLSNKYTPLGEARNLAIKQSKGEFIAFLDCDDLWLPNKLKLQIPLFKDQKIGIVISNTIFFNENGMEKKLYTKTIPPTGFVFKELIESYFISLETAIVRKSALNSLKEWFDERFEVIEEFDLFVRLSLNYKLGYVDEILGKWRVHENSWTWSKKDLFPKETRLFLKKLIKEIPDFKKSYCQSIKKLMNKVIIQEFFIGWENNNYKVNRNSIKSIALSSKKGLILYFISLIIPFKIFNFFNEKRLLLK